MAACICRPFSENDPVRGAEKPIFTVSWARRGCAPAAARAASASNAIVPLCDLTALSFRSMSRVPSPLRCRPVERPVAADGGAVHAADVGQAVAAAGLVGETAVVPDNEVAVAPFVPVVEARLEHDREQPVEQRLRFRL